LAIDSDRQRAGRLGQLHAHVVRGLVDVSPRVTFKALAELVAGGIAVRLRLGDDISELPIESSVVSNHRDFDFAGLHRLAASST